MNISPAVKFFSVVGCVYSTYIAARIAATIYDVAVRWKTGNWEV
jgi:hypothetical protein